MADEQTDRKAMQRLRKGRLWPILIVVLLMGVEGVGVFLLAKALGASAAPALGAGGDAENAGSVPSTGETAEVEVADCRPSNRVSGKLVILHIRVSAVVSAANLERAEALVRTKRARLEDGVNTVIRGADLAHLNEPTLKTVKRRLKHEFDQIIGDDQLFERVVIPVFEQSGSGV